MRHVLACLLLLTQATMAACTHATPAPAPPSESLLAEGAQAQETPFHRRPFHPTAEGRWIGAGICYGPHRAGQRPGGPAPSDAELREDLRLLAPRWNLLRIYGADELAERLLRILRQDRLPVKLLLGAWIAPERGPSPGPATPLAEARAANRREVEQAIRLANAYPDLVLAVVVGNETQVSWSDHLVDLEVLIGHVRQVRARTAVPVTTADDFSYWITPGSERLARELDFLVNHVHPLWNGTSLEDALAFTQARQAAVAARHPGLTVMLGESGWATKRHTEGDQAKLMKGETSEAAQRAFYRQFAAWVARDQVPSTFFEAFDEDWKGGPHPDEVEKHWGLFRVDRSPKRAMEAGPAEGQR